MSVDWLERLIGQFVHAKLVEDQGSAGPNIAFLIRRPYLVGYPVTWELVNPVCEYTRMFQISKKIGHDKLVVLVCYVHSYRFFFPSQFCINIKLFEIGMMA